MSVSGSVWGTAEKVIEVQGKVSALSGELSKSADTDPRSKR